ncbi:MAG: hypothetical protein K6G84_10975 [Lachnospiraceae bacterium]|nr:hypothetical protein [Lachnospiraceae bacterium]
MLENISNKGGNSSIRLNNIIGSLIEKYNASRVKEIVYYILFSIVYVRAFYYTTMFTELVQNNRIINWVGYGAAGCLLIMAIGEIITLILDRDIRTALLLSFLLGIGFISAISSTDRGIIVLCVLLVASVGKDMKTIIRISIVFGAFMMLLSYFASIWGYIPYLVYNRSRGELYHAFGSIYRTDFAAHILYIIMSYLWLRREKINSFEYVGVWVLTWFCWRYTGAKNDVFCLILLLTSFAFMKINWLRRREWLQFPRWSCLSHILCAIGVFIAVLFYGNKDVAVDTVEGTETFMSRFMYSMEAIKIYGFSLFGKAVEERGAGGIADISKAYFFLDIAYIRILIKYGILFLIIYLVLMTMNSYYAAVSGDSILVLILSVIAINSLAEHHSIEFCYNVFWVTGMTLISKRRSKNNTRGGTDKIALIN